MRAYLGSQDIKEDMSHVPGRQYVTSVHYSFKYLSRNILVEDSINLLHRWVKGSQLMALGRKRSSKYR